MVLECCFAVVLFQGGNNWVSGLSLSELGKGGGGGGEWGAALSSHRQFI